MRPQSCARVSVAVFRDLGLCSFPAASPIFGMGGHLGMLVLDRGQFGLQEVVQPRENPTGAAGGTAGPAGRIATCVLLACNTCGFVRLHSLTAIGLDNMV